MTLRDLVHRKIADVRKPIEDALISGSPTTLHEYHRLVGKFEGLQLALREIDGLLNEEFEEN